MVQRQAFRGPEGALFRNFFNAYRDGFDPQSHRENVIGAICHLIQPFCTNGLGIPPYQCLQINVVMSMVWRSNGLLT